MEHSQYNQICCLAVCLLLAGISSGPSAVRAGDKTMWPAVPESSNDVIRNLGSFGCDDIRQTGWMNPSFPILCAICPKLCLPRTTKSFNLPVLEETTVETTTSTESTTTAETTTSETTTTTTESTTTTSETTTSTESTTTTTDSTTTTSETTTSTESTTTTTESTTTASETTSSSTTISTRDSTSTTDFPYLKDLPMAVWWGEDLEGRTDMVPQAQIYAVKFVMPDYVGETVYGFENYGWYPTSAPENHCEPAFERPADGFCTMNSFHTGDIDHWPCSSSTNKGSFGGICSPINDWCLKSDVTAKWGLMCDFYIKIGDKPPTFPAKETRRKYDGMYWVSQGDGHSWVTTTTADVSQVSVIYKKCFYPGLPENLEIPIADIEGLNVIGVAGSGNQLTLTMNISRWPTESCGLNREFVGIGQEFNFKTDTCSSDGELGFAILKIPMDITLGFNYSKPGSENQERGIILRKSKFRSNLERQPICDCPASCWCRQKDGIVDALCIMPNTVKRWVRIGTEKIKVWPIYPMSKMPVEDSKQLGGQRTIYDWWQQSMLISEYGMVWDPMVLGIWERLRSTSVPFSPKEIEVGVYVKHDVFLKSRGKDLVVETKALKIDKRLLELNFPNYTFTNDSGSLKLEYKLSQRFIKGMNSQRFIDPVMRLYPGGGQLSAMARDVLYQQKMPLSDILLIAIFGGVSALYAMYLAAILLLLFVGYKDPWTHHKLNVLKRLVRLGALRHEKLKRKGYEGTLTELFSKTDRVIETDGDMDRVRNMDDYDTLMPAIEFAIIFGVWRPAVYWFCLLFPGICFIYILELTVGSVWFLISKVPFEIWLEMTMMGKVKRHNKRNDWKVTATERNSVKQQKRGRRDWIIYALFFLSNWSSVEGYDYSSRVLQPRNVEVGATINMAGSCDGGLCSANFYQSLPLAAKTGYTLMSQLQTDKGEVQGQLTYTVVSAETVLASTYAFSVLGASRTETNQWVDFNDDCDSGSDPNCLKDWKFLCVSRWSEFGKAWYPPFSRGDTCNMVLRPMRWGAKCPDGADGSAGAYIYPVENKGDNIIRVFDITVAEMRMEVEVSMTLGENSWNKTILLTSTGNTFESFPGGKTSLVDWSDPNKLVGTRVGCLFQSAWDDTPATACAGNFPGFDSLPRFIVTSGEYWLEEGVEVMPQRFRMPGIKQNGFEAGTIAYETEVVSKFSITELNTMGNDLGLLTGCDVNVTKVPDSKQYIEWRGCSDTPDVYDTSKCGGGNCKMKELHPHLIETRLTNCGGLVNLQTVAENVQYTVGSAGLTVLSAETFMFSVIGCYGYAGRATLIASQSEDLAGALVLRSGSLQISGFTWVTKKLTNFTATAPISEGMTVEGLKEDGVTWVTRPVSGVLDVCETFSDPDDCPGCEGGDSVPTGGLEWWVILIIVVVCVLVLGIILWGCYKWKGKEVMMKAPVSLTPARMVPGFAREELKRKAGSVLNDLKRGMVKAGLRSAKSVKKEHDSDDEDKFVHIPLRKVVKDKL